MEVGFRYMEFFWLNAAMAYMLAQTVLKAQPVLLSVVYCGLFGCAPPTPPGRSRRMLAIVCTRSLAR